MCMCPCVSNPVCAYVCASMRVYVYMYMSRRDKQKGFHLALGDSSVLSMSLCVLEAEATTGLPGL